MEPRLNTVWHWPKLTAIPSGILIHPNVWPHTIHRRHSLTGQDRQTT